MKPRILIIRGGAIGDFILTLPALGLVREAFPNAHIEIIGYRHIVSLAEGRYYADSSRSIEYGPLAGFFARNGTLDEELQEYFASFQQIISFLFDPDGIFAANLARVGVKHFLNAYVRINDSAHAAEQLARPLESLALYLENPNAVIHPNDADHERASAFLGEDAGKIVALHPGSGSSRKNWPLDRWQALIAELLAQGKRILLVGGEADHSTLDELDRAYGERVQVARDISLPILGAILGRCAQFIGHDSGISHLAAAAKTPCVLLFGPTDSDVWAPAGRHVRVVEAPGGDLAKLELPDVLTALP